MLKVTVADLRPGDIFSTTRGPSSANMYARKVAPNGKDIQWAHYAGNEFLIPEFISDNQDTPSTYHWRSNKTVYITNREPELKTIRIEDIEIGTFYTTEDNNLMLALPAKGGNIKDWDITNSAYAKVDPNEKVYEINIQLPEKIHEARPTGSTAGPRSNQETQAGLGAA